jgi:hypothetical protein
LNTNSFQNNKENISSRPHSSGQVNMQSSKAAYTNTAGNSQFNSQINQSMNKTTSFVGAAAANIANNMHSVTAQNSSAYNGQPVQSRDFYQSQREFGREIQHLTSS